MYNSFFKNTYLKIIILIFVLFILSFSSIILLYKLNQLFYPKYVTYIQPLIEYEIANAKLFKKFIKNESTFKPDLISIHLNEKHMRSIQIENQKLLNANVTIKDLENIWYPITLTGSHDNGEIYKAKIRIRGDTHIHWKNTKKSWRIKFKKNNLYNGIRVLDLIIPHDKLFANELTALNIGEKIGLIVPEYKTFNIVSLNGVNLGLYYAVEANSKEMLEKLGKPAGEIFSQKDIWLQSFENLSGISIKSYDNQASTYSTVVNKNINLERSHYYSRFYDFLNLSKLNDLNELERIIPYYLNIEKFTKWNALTWLFGSTVENGVHSHASSNLRWYYNPSDGRFEPLLYDLILSKILYIKNHLNLKQENQFNLNQGGFEFEEYNELIKKIMRIPKIHQQRNQFLWDLLKVVNREDYIINIYKKLHSDLKPYIFTGIRDQQKRFQTVAASDGLHPSYESYVDNNIQILEHNINLIKDRISFNRVSISSFLNNNKEISTLDIIINPDSLSELSLRSIKFMTLNEFNVDDIYLNNQRINDFSLKINSDNKKSILFNNLNIKSMLDDKFNPVFSEYILSIKLDRKIEHSILNLDFDIINMSTKEKVSPKYIYSTDTIINKKNIYSKHKNMKELLNAGMIEVKDNVLTFNPGEYLINKNLIIPREYSLILQAGTKLKLKKNVSILVNNKVEILGLKNKPVIIQSQNTKETWGTFAVLLAEEKSIINNLIVSGGSEAWIDGIYFSSQLSIHKSNVEINNSKFTNAKADDSLNIKNSQIKINNCLFYNNISDGFDGDSVNGIIENSSFLDNKGDGIDISHSKLITINNIFMQMGDKAISVGEDSDILVSNSVIGNSNIAVASKDDSETIISNSLFLKNEIALNAYQKKKIFNGGSIKIFNSILSNNKINTKKDKTSKIIDFNIIYDNIIYDKPDDIFDIGIDLRKQKINQYKKIKLENWKEYKEFYSDNFIGLFDRLTPDAVL